MVSLRYFKPDEFFGTYDKMVPAFLAWLDEVRGVAGVSFFLTSTFRTPAENAKASGAFGRSLHLSGLAVDFTTPASRQRDAYAFAVEVDKIARARYTVPAPKAFDTVEFEVVRASGVLRPSDVTPDLVADIRAAPSEAAAMAVLQSRQHSDWHIHLGLHPTTAERPDRLIVAAD